MKVCATCGIEKPRTDFFVRRASKDGLARVCKVCDEARVRQWCADNPDRKKAIANRWVAKHPDQAAANVARWSKENPEKRRAKYNRWAKANPEKAREWKKAHPEQAKIISQRWRRSHSDVVAAQCGKRRAARLRACPPWADLGAIKKKYAEARRLTKETGVKHHVDHEVPLRGEGVRGLHVDWNLRVIPASANLKKGNTLLEGAW